MKRKACRGCERRQRSLDDVCDRLGLLLWHLTDGRLSKPGYTVPVMLGEIEDVQEKATRTAIAEVLIERRRAARAAKRRSR